MMTTSVTVSHITLGVSPNCQNKHKVKSPPVLVLMWHFLMVPACLSPEKGIHGFAIVSNEGKTKHPAW